MLVAIATGVGLQKKIREKISGFNGHLEIINFDENQSLITLVPIDSKSPFLSELKQNKEIKSIQAFATKAGIIKTNTDFEGIVLKGVGTDYDWNFFNEYLLEGNLPHYQSETSNDILVSKTIADKLHLKVGDQAKIWFVRDDLNKPPQVRNLTIKGIYKTGFPDFDNTYIIADIRHIQKLNKWDANQVGGFEVFIKDFNKLEQVGKEVYKTVPSNINSLTILEQFPLIFEWIALFDSNIVVIISIMVLVAGFNMITALLVLILEQTRMIGILKAMGSTNWQIRKIFMYQATYLVLRGLFWGNIIGLSILLLQKYFGIISLNPENYYVDKAPVYLHWTYILFLNIGVIALSYVMLLLPSHYITKISPVKAIRFE